MSTAMPDIQPPPAPPAPPAPSIGQRPEPAGTGADPAIRVRGLSVDYPIRGGIVPAVDQLDLTVPRGQHLAVVGPSGSGKTTLLGCLSGRIAPTAGTVACDGSVAVIYQDLRLVKQQSALWNVLHGCLGRVSALRGLVGFPRAERVAARQWLARVGLTERMHTPVARLSGGEQQRVAIARALMQRPAILLADEPVAALDTDNARAVMHLLAEIGREHDLTVISVLHDFALAEDFADRVVAMARGRWVGDSTAAQSAAQSTGQAADHDRSVGNWPPTRLTDASSPAQHDDPRAVNFAASGVGGRNGYDTAPTATGEPDGTDGDAACEHPRRTPHGEPPVLREPSDALLGRLTPWRLALFGVIGVLVYGWALAGLNLTSPQGLSNAVGGMWDFAVRFVADMPAELPHLPYVELAGSLIETLQMALIGTTLAIALAWPMAALAARNVAPAWGWRPMRGLLNAIRTVPSIIWALLFVAAVGVGALAGVLALTAYTIGYLTKFYYEGFESVDPGPPGALREIGAGGAHRFRHAIWPASRPIILSSSLFMAEYNVRAASVLGVVGAGGIGWYLKTYIEARNFPAAFVCLGMLLIVVFILDAVSTRLRARVVDG